ncbi:class I SAM-dependent methyltransferase [Leptospira yanagawae]|uniref:Class I SAM-dependent methyltransferase n=1 Tax=Leptospira yanagawae TaxID=293069 RepID=A0ABY2LWT8_9LEPT|nr:class I SAM-dependent methyltransferase [Leptospira yanagawae]TGL16967.1 class I SAM-dependent methyltransferase [Leptospira yanagawae]
MKTKSEINQFFLEHAIDVPCICGNHTGWSVSKYGRYGNRIEATLCYRCGHVWAKKQLKESDLKEFYAFYYRELYSNGKGLKNSEAFKPRIEASKKNILSLFNKYVNNGSNSLVVEWGCGAGWNLIPFQESGIRVIGYDLDIEYTRFGKEEYNLNLHTINDYIPDEGLKLEADFLILNHVLEHVTTPEVFLKSLVKLLKAETGLFYIGLPVIESLPIWGYRNFFHIAHLHYFSGRYFVQWMKYLGFEPLEIKHEQGIYLFKYKNDTKNISARLNFRLYNFVLIVYYYIKYIIIYSFLFRIYENSKILKYLWRTFKSFFGRKNYHGK